MSKHKMQAVYAWIMKHPTAFYLMASAIWILLLYGRTLWAGFCFYDDLTQIVQNGFITSIKRSLVFFDWATTFASDSRGDSGSFYRPIFWLSLAVDRKLWGLTPALFHFTNIALHWFAAYLLFVLLRQLKLSYQAAMTTALVWLAMPVNAEVVAWISGRPYSLATCFAFLSCLSLNKHLSGKRIIYLFLYVLCGLLAILSHEVGAIVAGLTLLLVLTKQDIEDKTVWSVYLSCTSIYVVYLIMRWHAATVLTGPRELPTVGLRFWKYCSWLLLPAHMSLERSADTPSAHWSPAAICGWVILMLACALAILIFRWSPVMSLGFGWIVGALLPFCGFVYIYDGMAERYTYLASIGAALIIVQVCLKSRYRLQRFVIAAAVFWLCWGIYRLEVRITDWSNPELLSIHSLATSPSMKLMFGLAAIYETEGKLADSLSEYHKILDITPHSEMATGSIATILLREGHTQEAIEWLHTAEALEPNDFRAFVYEGTVLEQMGKTDMAEQKFRHAIQIQPDDDSGYCDLGLLLYRKGDIANAVLMLTKATTVNPSDPIPLSNLAHLYSQTGNNAMATKLYTQIRMLNPNDQLAALALQKARTH